MKIYENSIYSLELNEGKKFFVYKIKNGTETAFSLPVCEINGEKISLCADFVLPVSEEKLSNGATDITVEVKDKRGYVLTLAFRVCDGNEMIKYSFSLKGEKGASLTKKSGEFFEYVSLFGYSDITEIRFSEYNHFLHSFALSENKIDKRLYNTKTSVMGPMIIDENEKRKVLIAYEHGSQYPDKYLEFSLDENLSVRAVKGNYPNGRKIDDEPFESIIFQIGVFTPEKEPSRSYRDFQLKYSAKNLSSREPYIFYNTWCMQERDKWYNKNMYLTSMTEDRIIEEIEIAHKMGVDVFVIDTGWYVMTGDWKINYDRFPNGFDKINALLKKYSMKLGLWFNPKAAAVESEIIKGYEDCIMTTHGENNPPFEVWETPESYEMCLVSRYWKRYADTLISLIETLGVTYFKWDAIGQYGCDSAHHLHGDETNTEQERADCYAFSIGLYMAKIVDRVCEKCPEAIIDFDITEPGRYTGLGFLSSGKYFLINNGAYYQCYDIPEKSSANGWNNLFVFPGNARTWICRSPLDFDKWIPSVLFLTHYLPDGDRNSQITNIASLILGQNGIWADLKSVSEDGIKLFNEQLGYYKKVRYDITRAYPITYGKPGYSVEVHEKISSNGKGAIAVFTDGNGQYEYLTKNKVTGQIKTLGDITCQTTPDGCLLIKAKSNGIIWSLPTFSSC